MLRDERTTSFSMEGYVSRLDLNKEASSIREESFRAKIVYLSVLVYLIVRLFREVIHHIRIS